MMKVDVVDVDVLLSDFLKRVANDKPTDGQIVRKAIMNIVGDLAQDTKLQHALVTSQKCGSIEQDPSQPLMALCNTILDELREEGWRDELNTHLQENNAHPIQFVCSDTLSLKYDFPSNEPSPISGRPGILIALKNALKDHARVQAMSKDAEGFETSAMRTTPEITFKDVLGCMGIKFTEGEAVETPNNTLSQSSQVEGPSEEPNGSKGDVLAEANQPKSSSKREGGLENDASSRKRPKTGTDQIRDGEKAREENADLHQLGHYAAEFLSRGLYVAHNIGIMVNCKKVRVCWFDRQNVISTSKFDIFKDFSLFITFITVLSRFSLSDWGIDERFYPKEGIIEATLQGDRQLYIGLKRRPLCHRVALHGRGTMVFHGKMTIGGITQPVVVKTSYPQVNRLSERVFVSKGDQCENKTFLPIIHHDEDVGFPTSQIRQRLNLAVNEETCRPRRIMVSEPLHNIDTLPAMKALMVWYQCIHIHREMWQIGCQHSDISIRNLMYRREIGEEGKIVGVLNDWDLSILCDDSGSPVTNGFIGTIPFVALDLIANDSQARKYRHEMESFIWTLLYLCLDHEGNQRHLTLWDDSFTSASIRAGFLPGMEKKPREGFEALYKFACSLMRWFLPYIPSQARTSPNVDDEPTGNSLRFSSGDLALVEVVEEGPTWEEPNEEQIWK